MLFLIGILRIHSEKLMETTSNSNQLPLIRIQVCPLAWGGFRLIWKHSWCASQQICHVSANVTLLFPLSCWCWWSILHLMLLGLVVVSGLLWTPWKLTCQTNELLAKQGMEIWRFRFLIFLFSNSFEHQVIMTCQRLLVVMHHTSVDRKICFLYQLVQSSL